MYEYLVKLHFYNSLNFFTAQSHLNAITKTRLAEQKPMKKIIEKKIETDDSVLGYLWAAYNLAKRELPKEKFTHILDLLEMAGKDLKRDSTVNYTSNYSITEFQASCAQIILEDKLSALTDSPVYSIIIDESTDIGNRKRLLIYAQYLSQQQTEMCLLNNIGITECKASADVILSKITEELKQKGIKMSSLVGIGTDGASVMTGCRNGVVKQLREKCPSLIGVHCAAHRCALAASQATKDISEMEWYSRTVTNVFRFFSNSALRENKLREIQTLLQQPQLKYVDVHSVRWLSMESAVCILYRTYAALYNTLSDIGSNGDVVAKSLFNDISQFKFIALTHLLMDILPFLGRLSKVFQSDSLDFSKIAPMVESTCKSLRDLIECEGVFVDKLNEFVEKSENNSEVLYKRPLSESSKKTVMDNKMQNVQFDGFEDGENIERSDSDSACVVTLKYYEQQKQMIPCVSEKYINSIVQNLENRFQEKHLISAMEVLVPVNISKQTALPSYGTDEETSLADNFSAQLNIDTNECLSEYIHYKRLVKGSYQDKSVLKMTMILKDKYSEELPNMLLLLQACVVIPMTSAKCERGFSTQNRIKTKLRTRLNNQSLVDLMRISEDGPALKQFDFGRALLKWKNAKIRKLYSK